MTLGLTLVFERDKHSSGKVIAYDKLTVEDTGILASLRPVLNMASVPISRGMDWFDERGLTHTPIDLYGDKLRYMPAYYLRREIAPAMESSSPWNKAVLEFLRMVSPHTRVVLYWC